MAHPAWLHPARAFSDDIRWPLGSACERREPVLNMMLHSGEPSGRGALHVATAQGKVRV
jgi:hypothetical protein